VLCMAQQTATIPLAASKILVVLIVPSS